MKIPGVSRRIPGELAFSVVALLAISSCACKQPATVKNYCRDRQTFVNGNTGVEDDPIVVCPNFKMTWADHGETWEVEFKGDSAFEGKPKKVNKGNPTGVDRIDLKKDTAFPYSITVNGKKFDPQIIVMGGDN